LTIVVKPADDPSPYYFEYADSKLTIHPSDYLLIGILGDAQAGSTLTLGMSSGPGSLDVDNSIPLAGVEVSTVDDAQLAADLGIQNMFLSVSLIDPPASGGLLVRESLFHCEGEGDVTIYLFDENYLVADTQVIHQTIPEPASLALLGLGGLAFFRKRR